MSNRQFFEERRNLSNDPRYRASQRRTVVTVEKAGRDRSIIVVDECILEGLIDDGHVPEGHDGRFEVATHNEVCGVCNGSGTCVNPSIDAGGLSREDFEDDPDFEEAYFEGAYDITCPECKGQRVVPVVDADAARPWLAAAIADAEEDADADLAERMAEFRAGA